MRILGVDPGTRFLGIGIVEGRSSGLLYIWHEVLNLDNVKDNKEKLVKVFNKITDLIKHYDIDTISLEKAYIGKDYHASELLNQVRGVILLSAGLSKIPVFEYPPAKVKKIVTGDGRAEKSVVAKILELTFSMNFESRYDATDALALAVCHFYISKTEERYDRIFKGKGS